MAFSARRKASAMSPVHSLTHPWSILVLMRDSSTSAMMAAAPCDFGSLRLSAAHAAQTRRHKQETAQVSVIGNAELHAAGVKDCIESAVHDTLGADIHPAAGCHLSVVGHTHLHCFMPVTEIVEHSHHHRVGDYDTRRILAREGKRPRGCPDSTTSVCSSVSSSRYFLSDSIAASSGTPVLSLRTSQVRKDKERHRNRGYCLS